MFVSALVGVGIFSKYCTTCQTPPTCLQCSHTVVSVGGTMVSINIITPCPHQRHLLSEILIKPETSITCSAQSVYMGTWLGGSQHTSRTNISVSKITASIQGRRAPFPSWRNSSFCCFSVFYCLMFNVPIWPQYPQLVLLAAVGISIHTILP